MTTRRRWIAAAIGLGLGALLLPGEARAQYNRSAGVNQPTEEVTVERRDKQGRRVRRKVRRKVKGDRYGNAQGSQYDLAVDGAFDGQTVVVLHFYTAEGFDFSLPRHALKQKGFAVYRWSGGAPSPEALARALKKACQLWIISDSSRRLNARHLKVIKAFFDSGRGVYIWGDNAPYYADANFVAQALLGTTMQGNLIGDKTVGLQREAGKRGFRRRHLLTTGLEYLYEGVTIATIQPNKTLQPLIHGSANNLVAAIYDKQGRRAILDGGFTRLYIKWDTAGTARYVKNAAAWLANAERFGDKVVAKGLPTQ
jgi:hypothetical protein